VHCFLACLSKDLDERQNSLSQVKSRYKDRTQVKTGNPEAIAACLRVVLDVPPTLKSRQEPISGAGTQVKPRTQLGECELRIGRGERREHL
jgi:hypothetical protein